MNKILKPKELEALKAIRNWIVHHGRAPSVRELMGAMKYRSPRSAALIINNLIDKGLLRRRLDGAVQLVEGISADAIGERTVNVPLIGTVACGLPILAEENIEAMIPVSTNLVHQGSRYFLLRAKGDSMDQEGINDGDFVLVRQQPTANNGDIVVALIDDDATVKEFHQIRNTVILKPKSSNKEHQPIILTTDFQIQGVVVSTIPNFE